MPLCLILLAGLAGCGQASPDNALSLGSRVSTNASAARDLGQGEKALSPPISSATQAGTPLGQGTVPARENMSQEDKLVLKSESAPNSETDGRDTLPAPAIPEWITKGLSSSDPRERLMALYHWEAQGTTAPLDPLFAALDDTDGQVRAKATEIIERYYASEQEQEQEQEQEEAQN